MKTSRDPITSPLTKNEAMAAFHFWKALAEKAEAELVTLKKDVCEVSEWCFMNGPEYIRETASRILEETKEEVF